jgi:serpin B
MKPTPTLVLLRRLVLALVAGGPFGRNLAAQGGPDDAKLLAAACNQFAADLHARLAASGDPTCSPASVAISLLVLLTGARGETATEIATALYLPAELRGARLHAATEHLLQATRRAPESTPGPADPALRIVNDVWAQARCPVDAGVAAILQRHFGASVRAIDFAADPEAARTRINAHVGEATEGRIRDLLAPGFVGDATRLVLANALWLCAPWQSRFARIPGDGSFMLADGSAVAVPMMGANDEFAYAAADGWQCVRLPFRDCGLVCDVVLPRAGAPLAAPEQAMLRGSCAAALRAVPVRVTLPRFRVAAAHCLRAHLAALGIRAAFDAARADLPIVAAEPRLSVDDIVHRTWIAVDEHGAEAAAATATLVLAGAAARPRPPEVFTADRPFAFAIRDVRTNLILFAGRVTDPRTGA